MEIDLVVQKRLKPNSTEIETLLMQPNEDFWRFASEIQPTDITSACFDEGTECSDFRRTDFHQMPIFRIPFISIFEK